MATLITVDEQRLARATVIAKHETGVFVLESPVVPSMRFVALYERCEQIPGGAMFAYDTSEARELAAEIVAACDRIEGWDVAD